MEFKKKISIDIRNKLIAYYLPQFHSIPENDQNHEPGFTEWTNVKKSLPFFLGHIQPKKPGDLGYYSLAGDCSEILNKQSVIAKNYGVFGFAFYYYYFDGKSLLDNPIEVLYKNKSIDLNYMIFWANENWTKNWDGSDLEILLKQNYSDEDDIIFIKKISKFFQDERYIKIDGRPVLAVYDAKSFPNSKKTIALWKDFCYKKNIPEPFLICAHGKGGVINPLEYGFDAAFEFPPHRSISTNISLLKQYINLHYFTAKKNVVIDYKSVIDSFSNLNNNSYKLYKCACPGWDNTARRANFNPLIYHNSTPALFKKWIQKCMALSKENDFIFINAWNEWGEGAYLEPDHFFGYAYLNSLYEAQLEFNDKSIQEILES
jgi:lipopolysaccharide biosynthesis protein